MVVNLLNPKNGSQFVSAEHLDIINNASAVNSNVTESQSPVLRSNWEKHGDVRPQMKKSDRGRHNNILDVSESLPSYSLDEEVVGIITMEDVMEELLQVENLLVETTFKTFFSNDDMNIFFIQISWTIIVCYI